MFYDHEEVEAVKNGLGRVGRNHPEWLAGGFAVLMEPTNATVEGGCQGSLRADVVAARPPRPTRRGPGWAATRCTPPESCSQRLRGHQPAEVVIDGLVYREGLNAVGITGGVAGNVIPDECRVSVNYRFAPDKSEEQAADVVRRVLDGFEVEITDSAPGALPGLSHPAAAAFVAMVGRSRCRSSAGPTSPGSPRSVCRRSTTVPATRTSRTSARSTATSRRSSSASRGCAPG